MQDADMGALGCDQSICSVWTKKRLVIVFSVAQEQPQERNMRGQLESKGTRPKLCSRSL